MDSLEPSLRESISGTVNMDHGAFNARFLNNATMEDVINVVSNERPMTREAVMRSDDGITSEEAFAVDWIVPNPSWNEIEVLISGTSNRMSGIRIELFNATRRLVKYWVIPPMVVAGTDIRPIELDISGVMGGIYNLQITQGGATVTRRVMIDR